MNTKSEENLCKILICIFMHEAKSFARFLTMHEVGLCGRGEISWCIAQFRTLIPRSCSNVFGFIEEEKHKSIFRRSLLRADEKSLSWVREGSGGKHIKVKYFPDDADYRRRLWENQNSKVHRSEGEALIIQYLLRNTLIQSTFSVSVESCRSCFRSSNWHKKFMSNKNSSWTFMNTKLSPFASYHRLLDDFFLFFLSPLMERQAI